MKRARGPTPRAIYAMQLALFNPADIAPTRGEARAVHAAERRKERETRRAAWKLSQWRKAREKQRRSAGRHPAECCGYWYPADSSWTQCHKCKKWLDYTSPAQ